MIRVLLSILILFSVIFAQTVKDAESFGLSGSGMAASGESSWLYNPANINDDVFRYHAIRVEGNISLGDESWGMGALGVALRLQMNTKVRFAAQVDFLDTQYDGAQSSGSLYREWAGALALSRSFGRVSLGVGGTAVVAHSDDTLRATGDMTAGLQLSGKRGGRIGVSGLNLLEVGPLSQRIVSIGCAIDSSVGAKTGVVPMASVSYAFNVKTIDVAGGLLLRAGKHLSLRGGVQYIADGEVVPGFGATVYTKRLGITYGGRYFARYLRTFEHRLGLTLFF